MGVICAIGGGEIGGSYRGKSLPVETKEIDQEIIKLSKKKEPKVLFIPTASGDSAGYINNFKQHYGSFGCKIDNLLLYNRFIDKSFIRRKILGADIIYVGGGNTFKMIKMRKKNGIIPIIEKAYKKGIIMSGISAGSICRFLSGLSDSRRDKNPESNLIMVKGLNFIKCYHSPHFDRDIKRRTQLPLKIKKTGGVYLTLDDGVALLVKENNYKIIKSKKAGNAYLYYIKNNVVERLSIKNDSFEPLINIIKFTVK